MAINASKIVLLYTLKIKELTKILFKKPQTIHMVL